jgi:hypothetical protein
MNTDPDKSSSQAFMPTGPHRRQLFIWLAILGIIPVLIILRNQTPEIKSPVLTSMSDSEFRPVVGANGQAVVGMAKWDESATQTMREALEDYDSIVKGGEPLNAKPDKNAALPADGGTRFYLGNGYHLTRVQSLSRLGGVDGFMFGPVIQFDSKIAPGNMDAISHVMFITHEAFQKLHK